jgi:hypothetical protein
MVADAAIKGDNGAIFSGADVRNQCGVVDRLANQQE